MGGSSLRGIFFVLALAFQAIATGGAGVAGALLDSESSIYFQHCEIAGTGDKGAPSDHQRHHHDCLLCQSCVGAAAPLASYDANAYLLGFRQASHLHFRTPRFILSPVAVAQAHRARAPPVLVLSSSGVS
jgi:hypothetical protein